MRFTGPSSARLSSFLRDQRTLGEHFDTLEARRMLRGAPTQTVQFDDPVDDDVWQIQLNGPGSFVATPGTEGLRTLTLTGTTVDSSLSIVLAPVLRGSAARGGNGELFVNLITGGTIGSIATDLSGVIFRPESGQGGFHGIQLSNFARSIAIGDLIGGSDIAMNGSNPTNRSAISLRNAFGANVSGRGSISSSESVISTTGVIDTLSADFLFDVSISAARIGTIDVTGDTKMLRGDPLPDQSFDITTSSTSASFGVKTITVRGVLTDSTWNIASRVQKIAIDTVFIPEIIPKFQRGFPGSQGLVLDVTGRVDALSVQGNLVGTLDAVTFGSINIGNLFDADLTATGALSNTVNAVDSFRAAVVFESSFTAPNGIGLFNTGRLDTTGIQVGWIGTLNITGTPNNDLENFDSSNIALNNASRPIVLGKLNVQGVMSGSSIVAANNLGDLTLRGMFNSVIRTGVGNLATSPASFSGNFRINSLRINARVGGGNNFTGTSIVSAAVIGSLNLNLQVATANAGTPFGFSFDTIQASTLTLTTSLGVAFGASSGSASVANIFATSGDFVLRTV